MARLLSIAIALLIWLTGCDSEDGSGAQQQAGPVMGAPQIPSAPPPGPESAMPPGDESVMPPGTIEIADAAADDDDDDAGTPDAGAGPDAATADAGEGDPDGDPAALSPRLGACQRDRDCEGVLVCREGSGATPGYCTSTCTSDDECAPEGGICLRSSIPGTCVLPCESDDACPGEMACMAIIGQTRRCGHPPPPPAGPFERCSLAADNCVDGYGCYRSTYSQLSGPGYCAPAGCNSTDDCAQYQPDGVTAVLGCYQGLCRFECETGTCPDGMTCELMEPQGIEPFERCHYVD